MIMENAIVRPIILMETNVTIAKEDILASQIVKVKLLGLGLFFLTRFGFWVFISGPVQFG